MRDAVRLPMASVAESSDYAWDVRDGVQVNYTCKYMQEPCVSGRQMTAPEICRKRGDDELTLSIAVALYLPESTHSTAHA